MKNSYKAKVLKKKPITSAKITSENNDGKKKVCHFSPFSNDLIAKRIRKNKKLKESIIKLNKMMR